MALSGEWVGFGSASVDRLAAVVAELKVGDPLAPVVVVVPSNPMGVWARRALGRRPGGVAGVEFTTLERLAVRLAGSSLSDAGRSPITDQQRTAAVRVVVGESRRLPSSLAEHPATARAVAEAVEAIRVGDAADQLAGSGRKVVRDVVAVGEEVQRRLAPDGYDEVDVLDAAAALDPGAPLVLHLPDWLTPAARRLVAAVGRRREVRVLMGRTGHPAADEVAESLVGGLGVVMAPPPPIEPPGPTEIRSLPDPDDEARHVVRWLLARKAEGVPFARMAVCYTATDPHRRALHRHLDAAGIPSNGPSMISVGETMAGRVTRALLDLVGSDLPRDAVCGLLDSGFVRSPDGRRVKSNTWDRLSRRAGVVRGLEQWEQRLGGLADSLRSGADPGERGDRARSRADECDALLRFVQRLHRDLGEREDCETWSDHARWMCRLLEHHLPSPGGRADWPEFEQEAAERLVLTIELLGGLDRIEPDPSWSTVRTAIEVELERTTRRHGRLGDGVLVGPPAVTSGAELDAVAVVGMVEGAAPRRRRGGVILGPEEHERIERLRGGPDLGDHREADQHRAFLAALAAAGTHRLCTWSRADLRRGRGLYRSRWLDDASVPETSSDSFAASLHSAEPELDVAHYELRQLDGAVDDRAAAVDPLVAAVPALSVGAEAVAARRWGSLGRWTGLVDPAHVPGLESHPLSMSRLEDYATCPFRYFLRSVLRLRPLDRPEEIADLDPRDRGSALHRVLERLVGERIARGDVAPDERGRAHELLAEECRALEAAGRTGEPLRWELTREDMAEVLDKFLAADAELRAGGHHAVAVELAFGEEEPLEVEVGGRRLRFRGSVDRVDRRADGSLLVTDYKTVRKLRGRREAQIREQVLTGAILQLPLYALAALAAHPAPAATAAYWYLPSDEPDASLVRVDLDEVDEPFRRAVAVFADGIEGGRFPAVPGEPTNYPRATFEHCRWCEFDAVCAADRDEQWARSATDPALEAYVTLRASSDEAVDS